MIEVMLMYAVPLLLAWPLGRYMAATFAADTNQLDRLFAPVETLLYRLGGIAPHRPMDWRAYGRALLKLNLGVGVITFLVLRFQGWLPLNPDGMNNLSWDLALHTMISFLANTNQQHYAGQATLSYFSQMFAITAMQVITPMVGLAVLAAVTRTLFAAPDQVKHDADGRVIVGNFHRDLVRGIVRLMLPLAFVFALFLVWQGVPATFEGARVVPTLDPAVELEQQHIAVGPMAPEVAASRLGTNGGGWYATNAATPLENPTPLSNFAETIALVLLPMACVFMFGFISGRRRLAAGILGIMLLFSFVSTGALIASENQPNAAFVGLSAPGPNMEGKEVRIGATASAVYTAFTTQTSNGSVNAMLDSLNPLSGAVTLMNMWMNVTFGGIGVGLLNFLLFGLLAAFLGSLMIGRSPEFLGRPLETKEIKLVAIALLLQPLLVLGMTALTFAFPAFVNNSNPGFHGVSQVLYEFTSAFANNGSGFEGLGDGTIWYNLTCAVILLLARFIPMLVPLAIAAHLAAKRPAPAGRGSLDITTPTFGVLTMGVIIMFALLSFLPVLFIGPIAEALAL